MSSGPRSIALWWEDDGLHLLDQRALPHEERTVVCRSVDDVARAIRTLQVRGAPAIGVAAAYGVALAARARAAADRAVLLRAVQEAAAALAATRPTAVNLRWALERMRAVPDRLPHASPAELAAALLAEAHAIAADDARTNRRIAERGAALLSAGERVLTHCNTGSLATADYGTALGIIRAAHEQGKRVFVYACETRPVLQGARLTMWELARFGIPGALITDNAAGELMRRGQVDRVIVGADRIAANGDVANKIGTYALAVLARAHELPFVVAAPLSTIDVRAQTGADIPLEERAPEEVTALAGVPLAPAGTAAYNPAFDITPHHLVTALVTEAGVAAPPTARAIADLLAVSAAR